MTLPIVSFKDFAAEFRYAPTQYFPEDWSGTVLDLLSVADCPSSERLCVVIKCGFISTRILRLFDINCTRYVLEKEPFPDIRSLALCDVAEQVVRGNETAADLDKAVDIARAAWAASSAAVTAADADSLADSFAAAMVNPLAAPSTMAAATAARASERERQMTVLKELIGVYMV